MVNTVSSLLRLPPVRALAFRLIDANIFRHSLEEGIKRQYIAKAPPADVEQIDDESAPPVAVALPRAAAGGSRS
jgi:hypothetical protein